MINTYGNNRAEVIGDIHTAFTYSHEVYGETFYSFTVVLPRLSDSVDYIKVIVSDRLIGDAAYAVGDKVHIIGQFRSYNNYSDTGNKLILTLFAKSICHAEDTDDYFNEILLNGFICKQPVYRTTPFGREITDILLAVNRNHNKSDYIPCIAWGRNAKFAETLNVGDNIVITGRMQSRDYQKKLSETETVTKTAYEISVSKIETDIEE